MPRGIPFAIALCLFLLCMPIRAGEPVIPRWWRTIDRWTMSCILILFGIGLLLGLAASPPLASASSRLGSMSPGSDWHPTAVPRESLEYRAMTLRACHRAKYDHNQSPQQSIPLQ